MFSKRVDVKDDRLRLGSMSLISHLLERKYFTIKSEPFDYHRKKNAKQK